MMKKRIPLMLCILFCTASLAHSFLPSSWIPSGTASTNSATTAEFGQFVNQIDTMDVNARFNIGIISPEFSIDGFEFHLRNNPLHSNAAKANRRVPLPGADGPRPHLSSGPHRIHVAHHGSFISMDGLQNVELTRGTWELVWRDKSPAGLLICGFQLDKDAVRNAAMLQKGNLYLTFPVWRKKALEEKQAKKHAAELEYKEFETERNDQIQKLKDTPNLLEKAIHFREAVKAVERMDKTGFHLMINLPSKDEVFDVSADSNGDDGDGLKIVKTGTLWSKLTNSDFHSNDKQTLIGSVSLQ